MKLSIRILLVIFLTCILFSSCNKDEEEQYLTPIISTQELTINNTILDIGSSTDSYTHRTRGLYETEITVDGYDEFLNNYDITLKLKRAKFLVPGVYQLPNDSLDGRIYYRAAKTNSLYSYVMDKNTNAKLTITEVIREPDPVPNVSNQPFTRISGSFSFVANSSDTTGSITVNFSFKDFGFRIYHEFPDFKGTVNQIAWEGDTEMDFSHNFDLLAYNHHGDIIEFTYPQTINYTGTYISHYASYQKRNLDGSHKIWRASNTNKCTITITKADKSKEQISGKVQFIGEPVLNSGATGNAEVNATFTDVWYNF